jgi:hypothetical protein
MKSGAFQKEAEAFNEFQKCLELKDEDETKANIISFTPHHIKSVTAKNHPLKLAAQSEAPGTVTGLTSYFYHHPEKNIALKITVKNGNSVYASIIAEADFDLTDVLVYCIQTDKYFIASAAGEYFIGTYDKFDLSNFSFDLIKPVRKLTLYKAQNFNSAVQNANIQKLEVKTEGILIELSPDAEFKVIIILTGNYKDFINLKDGFIFIPKVLMNDNIELLFY